jgi:hypothetical protein
MQGEYKNRAKGEWDNEKSTCACGCWNRDQHRYFEVLDSFHGDEISMKRHIAQWLRRAADQVEDGIGRFPDVFGCQVPSRDIEEAGGLCKGKGSDFIETVSVTLSMPWPG